MVSGDSTGSVNMPGSSSSSTAVENTVLKRTLSSPAGPPGRLMFSNMDRLAQGGATVSRRPSTQSRIDEILEVGRRRASSMSLHGRSSGQLATMPSERPPLSSDHAEEPDERTSFGLTSNMMNYQSTQSLPSLRGRRPSSRSTVHLANRTETIDEAQEKKLGIWSYLDGIWSIELENTGSVARDHLAVERTFLAWLRTSLAFASIGIAITQLFRLNSSINDGQANQSFRRLGRPLGATFIGVSILVLLLGYQRFYQPSQWLLKGKFPASRGPIVLLSLVAFGLMLVSLVVVVVVQPPSTN